MHHPMETTLHYRRTAYPLCFATILLVATSAPAGARSRSQVIEIVSQIQRADYEGNRAALEHLHGELEPFVNDQELASRVLYWQGFANWRRAINGFNDGTDHSKLRDDLEQGLREFDQASKRDPSFIEAKIGSAGCISLIGYLVIEGGAGMQDSKLLDLRAKLRQLRSDVEATDSDNPRLTWVLGPIVWKSSQDVGGGQAKAVQMYQHALDVVRKRKKAGADLLQPSWGEPELWMNLAYSHLHQDAPDLGAAEQEAESALKLIPYWHYVKDILMPQIKAALKKARSESRLPLGSMHLP
jgi:hypothetical protein